MSDTTTFSIRIPTNLLNRIDQAAQQAGQTRSTYILQWLPEYFDIDTHHRQRNTKTPPNTTTNTHRVSD